MAERRGKANGSCSYHQEQDGSVESEKRRERKRRSRVASSSELELTHPFTLSRSSGTDAGPGQKFKFDQAKEALCDPVTCESRRPSRIDLELD